MTKENAMKGTLYGVGIGSGNPELLTYQAVKCIKSCDVIAIPNSGRGASVAYDIVIQALPELSEKQILQIDMPMTKEKEILKRYHENGGNLLLQYLKQGDVAFLTLGDPSIYATYMYLHDFVLKKGGQAHMICGIPSFCSVASALNISLAKGDEMLHIIPASYPMEHALSLPGTKILMKAGKSFSKIKKMLLTQRESIDCYMVENCGMKTEKKYFSPEEMPEEAGYFTTIVVKEKRN